MKNALIILTTTLIFIVGNILPIVNANDWDFGGGQPFLDNFVGGMAQNPRSRPTNHYAQGYTSSVQTSKPGEPIPQTAFQMLRGCVADYVEGRTHLPHDGSLNAASGVLTWDPVLPDGRTVDFTDRVNIFMVPRIEYEIRSPFGFLLENSL